MTFITSVFLSYVSSTETGFCESWYEIRVSASEKLDCVLHQACAAAKNLVKSKLCSTWLKLRWRILSGRKYHSTGKPISSTRNFLPRAPRAYTRSKFPRFALGRQKR